MVCIRKLLAIFLTIAFLSYSAPLAVPATPPKSRCFPQQQSNIPPYPLAPKTAEQLRCDQLAEPPGDPNNSGPGVDLDKIDTREAHSPCLGAANGPAWKGRYQFIFARVLEAERMGADAAAWYEAAGDSGYTQGYVSAGNLYLHSNPPSYPDAISWYQKAMSHGSAMAYLMMGWLYQTGNGVQRDPLQASRMYAYAGDNGNTDAAYRVGMMSEYGDGVAKDPYLASQWFYKAGSAGNPYAQEELGYLFASGDGVPKNPRAAFAWFLAAGKAGLPRSETAVGLEYETGEFVEKDPATAVAWFRAAAQQGEVFAMYRLAVHLRQGDGVAWSEAEAASWFRKAADQGLALAQSSLGYGYMQGLGADAGQGVLDYRQAAYWLTKAAQQGEPHAQLNLGWLYESGRGVERNLQQARALYASAARSSDPSVSEFAKKFLADMPDYDSTQSASAQSSGSSGKTPDWVAPVVIVGGLALLFAAFSGPSSGGSAGSGSSGGYSYDSTPSMNTDWGSSSSSSTPTPVCHQVPVENAFGTQNGSCGVTPTNCGYSGATTTVCD